MSSEEKGKMVNNIRISGLKIPYIATDFLFLTKKDIEYIHEPKVLSYKKPHVQQKPQYGLLGKRSFNYHSLLGNEMSSAKKQKN